MSARCLELIVAEEKRGSGEAHDPVREVTVVYAKDGAPVAEDDALAPRYRAAFVRGTNGAFALRSGCLYELPNPEPRDLAPPSSIRTSAVVTPNRRMTGQQIAELLLEHEQLKRDRDTLLVNNSKSIERLREHLDWLSKFYPGVWRRITKAGL